MCKRTKITRAPCKKRASEAVPRAENIGDLITADHKVLNESGEPRNNHRHAVVVQDLATHSYPRKAQNSQETERSSRKFLQPSEKPKVISKHNWLKFCKVYDDFSWKHRTSTPDRFETNGIAECGT